MAKAPKPGGAGTSGARERASLRAKTVGLTVGDEVYRVPVYNLPMQVSGEFVATFGVSPLALVFSQDSLTSVKALWWLGRRCEGERVKASRFDAECDAMLDKAEDEPGFLALDFSAFADDDEDADPVEDDSPEV